MSEAIGQQLKELRESKSISLEQVSQATRIRLHYLKAIEAGNYSALPSAAQARGFLRSYAAYLNLDSEVLAEAMAGQLPGSLSVPSTPLPSPPPSSNLSEEGGAIFTALGEKLKNQRQLLELSLEDVELHTHIRLYYLEAMEAGRFADLPSPVQGRGMLSNYASFLGMDAEPLMLRYAEALQSRLNMKQAAVPRRRPAAVRKDWSERSFLRRLISPDFILGGLLIVFLGGFTLWGGLRISALRSDSAQQTATQTALGLANQPAGLLTGSTPTPGNALAATATLPPGSASTAAPLLGPEGEAGAAEAEVSPSPPAPLPTSSSSVQVYVVVRQRTWMRVLVDGKLEFEGRVAPGGAYMYNGDQQVELLTGNGAGLQVFHNQVDLGLIGMFGEVVNRIFTGEAILTPTPTLTPTGRPAPTSTPTIEGMETQTPTASATPALPQPVQP
jgi:cytoskeleton protein RodZ